MVAARQTSMLSGRNDRRPKASGGTCAREGVLVGMPVRARTPKVRGTRGARLEGDDGFDLVVAPRARDGREKDERDHAELGRVERIHPQRVALLQVEHGERRAHRGEAAAANDRRG